MTHQKILTLLEGSSSSNPMPFGELCMKSGLFPDNLKTVLEQMFNTVPAPINRATLTRGGKTQEVYWPTGMVGLRSGPQGIVINPLNPSHQQRPPRNGGSDGSENKTTSFKAQQETAKVRQKTVIPATPTQEETMTTQQVTIKHILDLVIAKPGIERDKVMQALVCSDGSNRKVVMKCISNGIYHNVLKQTKEDGAVRLHPGEKANGSIKRQPKPPKPEKKAVGKVVLGKEAAALRGDPKPAKAKRGAKSVAGVARVPNVAHGNAGHDTEFSVMLSDDDCLHINCGGDSIRLNPERVSRLSHFLSRIQPAA